MNKQLIFILFFMIGISCQNHHNKKSPDEDFDSFYLKFNQDLNFQNSRIKYPLKGKYYSKENKNPEFDYDFTLSNHLDFDNHKIDTAIYSIRRTAGKGFVEERLFIKNSEFMTDYKFNLVDGKWFLTFYAEYDED
jgi:hypothetical protein